MIIQKGPAHDQWYEQYGTNKGYLEAAPTPETINGKAALISDDEILEDFSEHGVATEYYEEGAVRHKQRLL